MKIIDDRSRGNTVWFDTVAVGDTFLDANGAVCIKVSLDSWFNLQSNTLVDVTNKCLPYELVNAELVLKDYKEE